MQPCKNTYIVFVSYCRVWIYVTCLRVPKVRGMLNAMSLPVSKLKFIPELSKILRTSPYPNFFVHLFSAYYLHD